MVHYKTHSGAVEASFLRVQLCGGTVR